jgi:hypothetical protein
MSSLPKSAGRLLPVYGLILLTGCAEPMARGPQGLEGPPTLTDDVARFVGVRTRLVWMQAAEKGAADIYMPVFRLMGFDSRDGRGQRVILDEVRNYFMPMLTSDGRRVVFSDRVDGYVYVVGFDGKGLRKVCEGMALEVWRDRHADIEYVFVQRGPKIGRRFVENPVYRVDLDSPKDTTLIWDRTPVVFNNFQFSADGRRVAIEAPWPRCISADPTTGEWKVFGRGCYPSIAPDNSYITWHMDGLHRNIYMSTPSGRTWWKVPLNTVPGFEGRKIHQPRWSNHVHYICLAGPHPDKGWGNPAGPEDFQEIEIYIGRFSRDFRRIEAWAQVSHTDRHSVFPDLWIERGQRAEAAEIDEPPPPRVAGTHRTWPGATNGLVFLWEHALADNQFEDPDTGEIVSSRVEPHGKATYGRFHTMDVAEGSFEAVDASDRIVKAVRKTNEFAVEAVVTPDGVRRRNDGAILSMWARKHTGDLVLEQWRREFYSFVRYRMSSRGDRPAGNWERLGRFTPGRPHHILVTCKKDRFRAYLDGEPATLNVDWAADLKLWEAYPLLFGNVPKGDWDFCGHVEAVALYCRYIPPAEAKAKYQLFKQRIARRAPAEKLIVRARLVRSAGKPSLEAMGTYTRALSHREYEVQEVIQGNCPHRRIVVAHWAVLDREHLKSFNERKPGETYRLELEPYADHEQLKSEWAVTLPDAQHLPLYYHRSRRPIDRRPLHIRLRDAITDHDGIDIRDLVQKHPELINRLLPLKGSPHTLYPVELAAGTVHIWNSEDVEWVHFLLDKGARLDVFVAARAGMMDEVKQFLEKDPKLLHATDRFGYTLLQRAALVGGAPKTVERVVRFLLEKGARMDIFTAAHRGEVETVRKLLAADKSLLTATTFEGLTPLDWSVRPAWNTKKCVEVTRLLLEAGADPNRRNGKQKNMTAVHYLADWGGWAEQADLLVEHKADLNALTEDGKTALDIASEGGWRRHLAERLRKLGAKHAPKKDRKEEGHQQAP